MLEEDILIFFLSLSGMLQTAKRLQEVEHWHQSAKRTQCWVKRNFFVTLSPLQTATPSLPHREENLGTEGVTGDTSTKFIQRNIYFQILVKVVFLLKKLCYVRPYIYLNNLKKKKKSVNYFRKRFHWNIWEKPTSKLVKNPFSAQLPPAPVNSTFQTLFLFTFIFKNQLQKCKYLWNTLYSVIKKTKLVKKWL